jgi:hypothetical protein
MSQRIRFFTHYFTKNARKRMYDLHYWAKPVDQLAVSIPIDFERLRLVFKELKDVIGRITVSKFVGKWVLVEVYANLLVVVGESLSENRLK